MRIPPQFMLTNTIKNSKYVIVNHYFVSSNISIKYFLFMYKKTQNDDLYRSKVLNILKFKEYNFVQRINKVFATTQHVV